MKRLMNPQPRRTEFSKDFRTAHGWQFYCERKRCYISRQPPADMPQARPVFAEGSWWWVEGEEAFR